VQPDEEARREARHRLDQRCWALIRLDAGLVEWTLPPAGEDGKRVVAEGLITDVRRPLEQRAIRLRQVADEVQRLTHHQLTTDHSPLTPDF
jgi:hypothetical protein